MTNQTAKQTILFIDDDEEFVNALGRIIQAGGYEVHHAPDGQAGVSMARQQTPDLIVLDFMMPGKNGFETCRELRDDPKLRNVPILAMTAFGQNIGHLYDKADANSPLAAHDYLEKPVEPNILLERISKLLRAAAEV